MYFLKNPPIIGFDNATFDLNLAKSQLIPPLREERDLHPTVNRKEYQFLSFKIGNAQFLDIMSFLGSATSFVVFFQACKPTYQNIILLRVLRYC